MKLSCCEFKIVFVQNKEYLTIKKYYYSELI